VGQNLTALDLNLNRLSGFADNGQQFRTRVGDSLASGNTAADPGHHRFARHIGRLGCCDAALVGAETRHDRV
jgi:hypothetical protein